MRSKKITALVILFAFAVASILIPPTFSWYDHSSSLSGGKVKYTRNELPVSNADVTMQTHKLKMDTSNPKLLYYDNKGQKQTEGNALTSATVTANTVQYFRTLFTNTDSVRSAMVNVYLTNYTNDPNLYLGTIYPTITEKNQSGQASKSLKSHRSVRVYFEDRDINGWSRDGNTSLTSDPSKYAYVVANNDVNNKIQLVRTLLNEKSGVAVSRDESGSNWVYYADLPENTTEFYFMSFLGTITTNKNWYKTRTFTEIKNGYVYYLTGQPEGDSTDRAECKSFQMDYLASATEYYEKITMSVGQYVDVSLPDGAYTGSSVTYSVMSGYTNYVSLDANTKLLTRTTSNAAKIKTEVQGTLGDVITLITNIITPQTLDAVPVVMNLEVPPTGEKIADEKPGTREVIWYIDNRNATSVECSFSNIIFTK